VESDGKHDGLVLRVVTGSNTSRGESRAVSPSLALRAESSRESDHNTAATLGRGTPLQRHARHDTTLQPQKPQKLNDMTIGRTTH